MTASVLLDVAGRRRSPATLPGYHAGRVPHNKGQTYPADPPTVDEIVPVLRQAPDDRHGYRVRAMIVVLWRAGLCVSEVLALIETDLDERRGSLLVRRGKGGSRARSGWTPGAGSSFGRGWPPAPSCRSARCSSSLTDPHAGEPGQAPRCGLNSTASPARRVCDDGLRRTSSATPMRSSSRERARSQAKMIPTERARWPPAAPLPQWR
jgi:hypothetical protein